MEKLFGKRSLKANKKGSLVDLIFIAVGLFVFAVSTLLAFVIYDRFNDNIQANTEIPTEAKTSSSELQSYYSGVLDNSFLFICVGLGIGAIILASLVRVHPIFFPFYIIALLFVIFFCGIFSNIYQEMASTTQMATEAAQLTFITQILSYLPLIIGIFGTILAMVMFKLWSNGNE